MSVASAADLGVMARLKADTRAQHDRAERALDLLRPDLNEAHYRAALKHLRCGHHALEPVIEAVLRAALPFEDWAALDLPGRRKAPLLDRDLAALGQSGPPALPGPAAPAWLRAEAHAWGAAYVLEGATLGGQVVRRHLRRAGLPEEALHYHGSYGEAVGDRWRRFGQLLSQRHAAAPDPAAFAGQAVDAARRTFELLTPHPPLPCPAPERA